MLKKIINSNVLVVIIFVLLLSNGMSAQKLSLRLELDTAIFFEAQSIFATVVLKNEGKDTAVVQPDIMTGYDTGMEFILKDENDIEIRKSTGSTHDDFGLTPDKIILPFDSLSADYLITGSFSNSEYRGAPLYAPAYMPTLAYLIPGKYKLQACANTGKENIYSNKIEFTVIKPTGPELKALQTLRAIELEHLEKFQNFPMDKYEYFIRDFPSSIYTPQAYSYPIFEYIYSPVRDINKAKKLLIDRIIKFPNSFYSSGSVGTIIDRTTIEERDSIKNIIFQKHPNSKVAKEWERVINENKANKKY